MNDSDKTDSVFLTLCGDTLKKLINQNLRRDGIKEIMEMKFGAKMSKEDYIQYMFFKAMSEMYKAGLEVGKNEGKSDDGKHLNEVKSIVYFPKRSSKRSIPADNFAMKLAPVLQEIRRTGPKTLLEIANKLTELGITTTEGGKWHPATVRSLENRIIKITSKNAEWKNAIKESANGE